MIAAALIVVGIGLGFAGGGIFTIVLLPLGLLALGAAAAVSISGRKALQRGGAATEESHVPDSPLPPHQPRPTGRAPTSPEALADARRAQQ